MKTKLETEIQKVTFRFLVSSLILLIAAIALSVVWNRSIKDELAIQASSFVRKGISSKEMRGVVEYLNGVQFSAFSHVSLYTPSNEHIITLPPVFDRKNLQNSFLNDILYSTISIPIFLDTESKNLAANISFTYLRFELAIDAILIWAFTSLLLGYVFVQAKRKVEIEIKNELKMKNAELVEDIAKKVRHNIRSPLASLRAMFIEKMFSPEMVFEQGVGVVKRLEEIIDALKSENLVLGADENKNKSLSVAIYDVTSIVSAIVCEKRLISKNIKIDLYIDNCDLGVYTKIASSEFKAMLSNIIDNSLQAITGEGRISITLSSDDAAFCLLIKDTGCGISPDNILKVFDKHFTHGKKDGSGLGLYYAKKLVDENLGNIELKSTLGEGSEISIILPKEETPTWHINTLRLAEVKDIVICDDQQSIIDAWRLRFREYNISSSKILSFHSCESLESQSRINEKNLYLIDYDLGLNKMTGLELIKRYKEISDRFVLVTGHFDEPWLQDECLRLNCKLLPKDHIFQIKLIS